MRVFVRALLAAALVAGGIANARPPAQGPAAEVALSVLPAEARKTIALIRNGGPYRYRQDGTVFGNREGRLPRRERGYYREFTVPTSGAQDRGARRIVAGRGGEYYYTEDHYNRFSRIRE